MRRSAPLKDTLTYLAALAVVGLFAFPLVWMLLTSLKQRVDVFSSHPFAPFTPTLANYQTVLASDFPGQLLNSVVIALASTLVALVLGAFTAYGFSRHGAFKGGDNLLFWVLSLRMLPTISVVVPFTILFNRFGLADTRLGLILVYTIFNTSLAVWLLKGFFDEVPRDLEEAAMLDGYSPPQVFRRVSLPMVRSGLLTTAVFCLIQSLNEFLLALLLTDTKAVTAPVGLANFQRYFGLEWGQFAAAAALFVMPVIVFTVLVRKELVRGMSFGQLE